MIGRLTAKRADEAGFDLPCRYCISPSSRDYAPNWTGDTFFSKEDLVSHEGNGYGKVYLRPSHSVLGKWLRDRGIFVEVRRSKKGKFHFKTYDDESKLTHESMNMHPSYELAMESGLDWGLAVLKMRL